MYVYINLKYSGTSCMVMNGYEFMYECYHLVMTNIAMENHHFQ